MQLTQPTADWKPRVDQKQPTTPDILENNHNRDDDDDDARCSHSVHTLSAANGEDQIGIC